MLNIQSPSIIKKIEFVYEWIILCMNSSYVIVFEMLLYTVKLTYWMLNIFNIINVINAEIIPCTNLEKNRILNLNLFSCSTEYTWKIMHKPLNPSKNEIAIIFKSIGKFNEYTLKEPFVTSNMPLRKDIVFWEMFNLVKNSFIILKPKLNNTINPKIIPSVIKDFNIEVFIISKNVNSVLFFEEFVVSFFKKVFSKLKFSCIIDVCVTKKKVQILLI